MKKNIISIAVIAATLLAASCQKEINPESGTPILDAPQFTASIENCGNTKTTVERVTTPSIAYKTYWESTDNIKINGATYQATPDGTDARNATFTYQSGTLSEGTYKAYFPASIYEGSTATLPATYTYDNYTAGKYNMPMYAESDATSLSFKNLCGILAITVPSTQMATVKSISITSDKRMNGAFTATAAGVLTFTSTAELTDADKKVTLSFTTAETIGSGSSATFYIPVPAGTHNPLTINVSDGTLMKTMVTKQSGGVSVSRNVVYPITFDDNQPLILPGLFSVSATKQVRFTIGNLYYSTTDSKYHLEAAQNVTYVTLGQGSSYTSSHVCHFFWSNTTDWQTSGKEPWASSYDKSAQSKNDKFFCCVDNTMTVDGQSGLYALAKDEWEYLFNTRTNASNLYKYYVSVTTSANCVVIAPDGYTGTIASSYDATAWATAESAGLVCLPAAGYHIAAGLFNGGSKSDGNNYWSATPWAYNEDHAYYLSGFKVYNESRGYGYSVRLVSTVSE